MKKELIFSIMRGIWGLVGRLRFLIPSRRHLLRRALYLLIVLALLSGMGLVDIGFLGYRLVVLAQGHEGEQTAQILPPDTDGYLTINLQPGLDQLAKMNAVLDNWNENPAFDNLLVEMMTQLEYETGIPIDIETEVLPWLGPELAIATCFDPAFMMVTEEQPMAVIIIGTTNKTLSDAFIFNKFLPLLAAGEWAPPTAPTGSYRGIETLYDPEHTHYYYWAFTNEYIIWSQSQARLEAVLDLYLDGGDSLATDTNFIAAQNNLPAERMAMGYVNVDHMVAGLLAISVEQDAATELANVQAAVTAMMVDNELATLPNPVSVATDDMGAFPDATSVCGTADKLLDPNGNPYVDGIDPLGDKDGYLLYGHDITGDNDQTTLVNYVARQYTTGTYTVDAAGTVTQVTSGYEDLRALLDSYLPSFAAGSAHFVDDGIKTDYYMPTPAGMANYPFPGENPINSAKLVPANALGFFSEQDLSGAWQWMKPIIASNWATIEKMSGVPEGEFPASLGDMITELNTILGFDIEADVLSWMNGEISFAMMPFTGMIPEQLLMFEVDDPILVQGKLETIVNGINTNLANQTTIFTRTDLPPFDDIRVVEALAMAIDRQAIIDTLGITVNFSDVGWREYNPAKATEILMECGYPTGFATEIVGKADHVDVLNAVQTYWAAIGVDLTIQVVDTAAWYSTWVNKTWEQMIIADNELQLNPFTLGGYDATSIWSAVLPPGISPCYAFLDVVDVDTFHYLVFSLTESALSAAIDTLKTPGSSLAQNGDYQWMNTGLPVSKMNLSYTNIQQVLGILPMIGRAAVPMPQPQPEEEEQPQPQIDPEPEIPGRTVIPGDPAIPVEPMTDGGGGEQILHDILPVMLGPLRSMGASEAMDAQTMSGTTLLHVQQVDSRVFVDPVGLEPTVGDSFTVDVCVDEVWTDGVSDLYSVEFHLAFDPSQLEVVDADGDPGNGIQITPYLPDGTGGNYVIDMNLADNAEGTIAYKITLLDPSPPMPPAAKLAAITFNCINPGMSSVLFISPVVSEPPVKLADSTAAPIPVIWFGGGVLQHPPSGRISGHVYQSDGITPIEGAQIEVIEYDSLWDRWRHYGWARTDAGGYYIVRNLPTGDYAVRAEAHDYIREWYPGTPYRDGAHRVPVTWPNETPGIDFTLDIGGTISGRITYFDGAGYVPIANCHVVAVDSAIGEKVSGANTNADGYYTIPGLYTGSYKVYAAATHSGLNYVNEWYNDKPSWEQADLISVTLGVDTPNKDFILDKGGSISGRITSLEDGKPIADCLVYATPSDSREGVSGTWTDQDGKYTLIGLPAGSYKVMASASKSGLDYLDEWYNDRPSWEQADPVPVTLGQDSPNINFVLQVGGTISGVVKNAGGSPLANVSVDCALLTDRELRDWRGRTTDAEGNYTFRGLPNGNYVVMSPAHGKWGGGDDNFITQYYNNKTSQELADIVTIDETQKDHAGINFILEVGGSISGRVTYLDGVTPMPIADLHVYAVDSVTKQYISGTNTDSNGYYTVHGLPIGGSYKVGTSARDSGLNFVDEWYNDKSDFDLADPVSVTTPDDIPNIDFVLDIAGTISGVVKDVGGSPLANVSVECNLLIDGKPHEGWGAKTDDQGNYTLQGLPYGDYIVHAPGWGRWGEGDDNFVTQYYNNKTSQELADIVTIDETHKDHAGINFILEVGGSISGRVTYLDGVTPMPIANCHVFAVDSVTHEWMSGTNTNADGYYTLQGLPTGSYKVRTAARDSGLNYIDKWYNDKPNFDFADPVSVIVADGVSPTNIDFTLEPTVPRATIAEAIHDGVAWLAAQQNVDGSWGTHWQVAKTALAVLKLETHAIDRGYLSPFDAAYPYHTHVQSGLDFLFANAYTTGISMQPAGDPDTRINGIGVYFRSPSFPPDRGGPVDIYETGIAMMAIAASTTPAGVVSVVGSPVDGWTYSQVLQDAVDYLAWAQTDYGFGRGGWNYGPMDNTGNRSDQSISGYATLGLAYAEDFGISIPGFVRTELNIWIDYIQDDVDGDPNDGGSWYTGPGDPQQHHDPPTNFLRTGNLLQQMAFVGDTPATPRVQHAIDYLVRHWDHGWRGSPTDYQTTYTVMKGLEALGIDTIGSINWFQDFVDVLLSEQAADGWWPHSHWDDLEPMLSTEWALLTLQKTIPPTEEKPDLIIIDKMEVWVNELAGTYEVHATLKNVGNLPVTEANHYVTLSIDGVPREARNVPLQDFAPGNTLLPIVFSGPFTLTDGDDEVKVCADTNLLDAQYDNRVAELNEQNNCRINHQPPLPDLTVVEKHEEWVDEGVYRVYYTVKNSGNVVIPAGYSVGLFVDGDLFEKRIVPQSLAPGEIYPGGFRELIKVTDGWDKVNVVVDVNEEVDESDEMNNHRKNTFAWPPAPDLVVNKHEEWVVEGQSYVVHYKVTNRGNAEAFAGHDVSLEVDGVEKETKEVTVSLGPGESYRDSFVTTVSLTGGVDKVKVRADINNEVNESREGNNWYENTFAWPPAPDLIIKSKRERWIEGQEGTQYTVQFQIRNIGNAPAPAGHDVEFAVDGTAIEMMEVPIELQPGQWYVNIFPTPITLSGGSDEIMVCADVNAEVAESDEGNNCRANTWPPEVPVCTYDLNAGLNLWALSRVPLEDYTASSLATLINDQGGSVTKIFRWYAGIWQGYRVGYSANDFPIELDKGYFILSEGPSQFDMPCTGFGSPVAVFDHTVTNVNDQSFTVSWGSQNPEEGYIRYGPDPGNLALTAYDDRGPGTVDDTHHSTALNLAPNTLYYYDIFRGGVWDDNGGQHYTVTTGPYLGIPTPDDIVARVFKSDGSTPAAGAIVYLTVTHNGTTSQTLSTVIKAGDGSWNIVLGGLRTPDYQSFFTYTAEDQVLLVVEGVSDGRAMLSTTVQVLRDGTLATTLGFLVYEKFNAGLNLWALSNIPATDYTASTLAQSINDQGGSVIKIFRWHAGNWQGYRVGYSANDFPIELGRGYFVLCTTPSTWGMPVLRPT